MSRDTFSLLIKGPKSPLLCFGVLGRVLVRDTPSWVESPKSQVRGWEPGVTEENKILVYFLDKANIPPPKVVLGSFDGSRLKGPHLNHSTPSDLHSPVPRPSKLCSFLPIPQTTYRSSGFLLGFSPPRVTPRWSRLSLPLRPTRSQSPPSEVTVRPPTGSRRSGHRKFEVNKTRRKIVTLRQLFYFITYPTGYLF